MRNKTARFLLVSIICISLLCVLVFSCMTFLMNSRGADALGELGTLYMSGMSEQAATHFGTTIELRLSQVSALTDAVPPGRDQNVDSARALLCSYARARGFDHLALLKSDGGFEMLFGDELETEDDSFFTSLARRGEEKMSAGCDKKGRELVLMGIPAEYPTEDGSKSIALVAAFPIEYISDTLSLTPDDALIYYVIIGREGQFIVRDSNVTDDNYFTRVLEKYEVDGASNAEYLAAIRDAMESGENFVGQFALEGGRRFQYGTPLPFSDWYLMLFMPYGGLDRTMDALGTSWGLTAVLSCVIILLALLIVFVFYFRLTRKHVRELEEARQLAEQANRAKSDFLSNMSHDIRTPMNGIVGMTAIASANLDDPQQVRNCLKKIEISSRHLLGLINDILDMSRIESGKLELHPENMSLPEVIGSAINMVQPQANAKRQNFKADVYDVFCERVFCDGVRFSQIFLNLLGNAIKFTPEGGNIRVACYEEPADGNAVRLHLTVEDTGIGMTQEFLVKIFDAFAREDDKRVQKTEGSGLGMAITKYLVDAMGGTIEVESEPNRGTKFHVTLTLEAAPADEETKLNGFEILVLSADETFLAHTAAALRETGCRAELAAGKEEAFRMAEEKEAAGGYRAVLWDENTVSVPDAHALRRAFGEKTAVIVLTEFERGGPGEQPRETGIAGYLSKPLFRSELAAGIAAICDPGKEKEAKEKRRPGFCGERILLAEDNELNREIAVELLSEIGLKLESAEDGKICTEMFANSPVGWYDAILMDIRMPVMSGYEAAQTIRAMDRPDAKTIPIVAMSADAFSEDVKRCLACGMNAHTAKPIDMDALAQILGDLIGGKKS